MREDQIYAGLTRDDIVQVEHTLSDFTKELNPLMRQWKIDVCKNKVSNLLTPSHFIRYGSNEYIQKSIRKTNSLMCNNSNKHKVICNQFPDYLIASLCINNGIRPSNIIALRLQDFDKTKDLPNYPRHTIITNEKYKTSIINGEKLIVVSKSLFAPYNFYVKYLRFKISNVMSGRVFLISGNKASMNQSNVSVSLTESFKLAKVFSATEHKGVNCTRIRCGNATYVCNERGFDESYFAKHFMKSRHETTAIHYNLLSNQRHALTIAMDLYDTFSVDGKKLIVKKEEVTQLETDIKIA